MKIFAFVELQGLLRITKNRFSLFGELFKQQLAIYLNSFSVKPSLKNSISELNFTHPIILKRTQSKPAIKHYNSFSWQHPVL